MMSRLGLLVLAIWSLASPVTATDFPKPSETFTHNAVLDGKDNYYIFWKYDNTSITFEAHVRTKGFVAFGISPNGGMVNADVVVGWVRNGKAEMQDRHTKGKFEPLIDTQQDWTLLSGHEDASFTVLKFKRDLDTCDDADDLKITGGTTKVIFAWSSFEPASGTRITYHGQNRGTKSLLLLDPPMKEPTLPKETYTYELRVPEMRVPSDRTTYWCTAFRFPKFDRKYHLIKYEPIITPGNEGIVHHILVYGCYHEVPLKHHMVSADCGANKAMPDVVERCTTTLLAWAIGGTAYNYPEHVGWPMGDGEDPTFLRMEIHYDNPMGRSDIVDSSGLRVYYTPKLRQFDSGLLEVGLMVTPGHIIPPQFDNLVNKGYCYKDCTSKAVPKEGVKFFTALPHAHLLGRGVSTKLVRNGEEIAVVSEDLSYDFDFQEYRHLAKEISFYPGDELITECHYKSTGRKTITHGGLGTTEEMCLSFLLYYPKMNLARCVTLPTYYVPSDPSFQAEVAPYKDKYTFAYSQDWGNAATRRRFQERLDKSTHVYGCERLNKDQILPGAFTNGVEAINVTKPLVKASTCPKN